MYYDVCPKCGCTLDPGEACEDCIREEEEKRLIMEQMKKDICMDEDGQFRFMFS